MICQPRRASQHNTVIHVLTSSRVGQHTDNIRYQHLYRHLGGSETGFLNASLACIPTQTWVTRPVLPWTLGE